MSDGEAIRCAYADLVEVVLGVHRELAVQVRLDGVVALTATEVAVMRFVTAHAGTSPSEVATALGLLRSNVSPALKSLERHGLLERRVQGRQVRLRSTPIAVENLRRIREHWGELLASALSTHPDGLPVAVGVLQVIEANLVHHRLVPIG